MACSAVSSDSVCGGAFSVDPKAAKPKGEQQLVKVVSHASRGCSATRTKVSAGGGGV